MPDSADSSPTLSEAVLQFVGAFEVVFQEDWPYTLWHLRKGDVDDWIAPGHDFLDPGTNGAPNWGAQAALLGSYRRLLERMGEQGVRPWRRFPLAGGRRGRRLSASGAQRRR